MKENEIFPTPSELFDDTDEELTATDTVVYVVLSMFLGRDSLTDFPSADEIAQKARISSRTVKRSLRKLEEKGYVETFERRDERGIRTTNRYIVRGVND